VCSIGIDTFKAAIGFSKKALQMFAWIDKKLTKISIGVQIPVLGTSTIDVKEASNLGCNLWQLATIQRWEK